MAFKPLILTRAVLKITFNAVVFDKALQFWGLLTLCFSMSMFLLVGGIANMATKEDRLRALSRIQGCEYIGPMDQYRRVILMECAGSRVGMFVDPDYDH